MNWSVWTVNSRHWLKVYSTLTDIYFSDGKYGDVPTNRIDRAVNIKSGHCISIDSSANSIWLGRGTGLVWRRKLTAYSEVWLFALFCWTSDHPKLISKLALQSGCPENARIDHISEKSGYWLNKYGQVQTGGNCIPIDYLYLGAQGVDQKLDGRLMSVKFESF